MIRAILYLFASGVIWLVEGFLFSRFLRFSAIQTGIMAVIYVALFAAALRYILLLSRRQEEVGLSRWRYLSLAPMLTVTLGSFASLPVLLAILVLGRI
jgi:hypothetical protein